MVEVRAEDRLVHEHLNEIGLSGQMRVRDFDGDRTGEAVDTRPLGQIKGRHAAVAELLDEGVASYLPARGECRFRHRGRW